QQPTQAVYLDYLTLFILAVYLIVSERRRGTTLGKRLVGLRVQSEGDGALGSGQAVKRTLVLFTPFYPFIAIIFMLIAFGPASVLICARLFMGLWAVIMVLGVAFLANFTLAVRRGNLPWHDRAAGTEVVRSGVAPR